MSTVVMPMTAEAAERDSRYGNDPVWYDFTDAANSSKIGATQFDGTVAGKHEAEKIAKLPATTTRNAFSSITTDSGVVTYEVSVYMTSGAEGIFHVFDESSVSNHRSAIKIRNNGTMVTSTTLAGKGIWEDLNTDSLTHAQWVANNWYKLAIEWNATAKTVKFYVNDAEIRKVDITAESSRTKFNGDIGFSNVTGTIYVDNIRIYTTPYVDVSSDVKPAAGGVHTFLAGEKTVAEVKTELLAEQTNASELVAHVYKYGIGGDEALDTDTIQKDWYAVVTSKSGEHYETVYKIQDPVTISATLTNGTLTATMTNDSGSVIPSMIMVLLQADGRVVKASDVQTNIGANGATFTITGVGNSVSPANARLLFIDSWDKIAPVLDELKPVQ